MSKRPLRASDERQELLDLLDGMGAYIGHSSQCMSLGDCMRCTCAAESMRERFHRALKILMKG